MKMILVIGMAFVLFFSSAYAEINTAYVEIKRRAADGPLFIENIKSHKIGETQTGLSISRWQDTNRNSQIINVQPEIKNGVMAGWHIFWKPAKRPVTISVLYMEAQVPFIVPEEIDLNSLLQQSWTEIGGHVEKILNEVLGAKNFSPIVFNHAKDRLGRTIVYGLWYKHENAGYYEYSNKYPEGIYRNPKANRQKHGQQTLAYHTKLPIPSIIAGRPELILASSEEGRSTKRSTVVPILPTAPSTVVPQGLKVEAEGEVVTMAPFRTFSEWMDLVAVKNNDGTLKALKVVNVTKGSPASIAGIEMGSTIVSIQGVKISGLTEEEFGKQVLGAPIGDVLQMEIVHQDGIPLSVSIPREKRLASSSN